MLKIEQFAERKEDAQQLANVIDDHIYRREPLSVLRCGDGEGHILDALHDPDVEALSWRLHFFFGHSRFALSDVRRLAEELQRAMENADCLGINFNHTVDEVIRLDAAARGKANGFSGLHSLYTNLDQMNFDPDLRIFDGRVHEQLVRKGHIYRLLSKLDGVCLITSRRLASRLSKIFGFAVKQHLIPEEQNFAVGQTQGESHFPEVYDRLHEAIQPERPGTVYLVGGGPCGKVYCDLVKQRGGIAIDLGAIFDSWAGLVTRLYFDPETDRIDDKKLDTSLMLTPQAIFETTGGDVDLRDRPVPALNVENRMRIAANRHKRQIDAEKALDQNHELWKRVHNSERRLAEAEAELEVLRQRRGIYWGLRNELARIGPLRRAYLRLKGPS